MDPAPGAQPRSDVQQSHILQVPDVIFYGRLRPYRMIAELSGETFPLLVDHLRHEKSTHPFGEAGPERVCQPLDLLDKLQKLPLVQEWELAVVSYQAGYSIQPSQETLA
jgi:hypothetical protein